MAKRSLTATPAICMPLKLQLLVITLLLKSMSSNLAFARADIGKACVRQGDVLEDGAVERRADKDIGDAAMLRFGDDTTVRVERFRGAAQLAFQRPQVEGNAPQPVPKIDRLRRGIAANADQHLPGGRRADDRMKGPGTAAVAMVENGRQGVVEGIEQSCGRRLLAGGRAPRRGVSG